MNPGTPLLILAALTLINLTFQKTLRQFSYKYFKIGFNEDEVAQYEVFENLDNYFDSMKKKAKDAWISEELNNRVMLGIKTVSEKAM